MHDENKTSISVLKFMARFLPLLIIPIVLVFSISKIFSEKQFEENIPAHYFTSYLDSRIKELMDIYEIPGATIALIKGGETVWVQAYGYADLETGRKMTVDTYVRVQSISKPVTAWGIMKLVEQGKIDLDSPVKHYIKNWKFPDSEFSEEKITIRQLLSHSAGMPLGDFYNYYSPKGDIPTLEASLTKEAVLIKDPGLSFSYSNTGFNLLELLIEEVAGRDFAEFMQDEVLVPLEMQDSSFEWRETLQPAVPFGYDLNGKAVPVYVYPEKGSGGLFSTVGDIATFLIAGMPGFTQNQHVLKPRSIDQLYTPMITGLGVYDLVFDSYGLGYYLEDLSNGKQAVSHGGQGTGWMTHFHCVPESGDGIVILTNSQRSWPFIANILSDWSEWNGFSPIGMSRIIIGQKILWAIVGLIWVIVFWHLWILAEGIFSKKLEFSPLSKKSRFLRLMQLFWFICITIVLLWCINQDYLFISSVFPIVSIWLGWTLMALAFVSLLLAMFPKKGFG
jgi:CubicO group peptidase (beta-lactamase class C family)